MNAKTAAPESWYPNAADRTGQTDDERIKDITVLPPPEHLIRFFPIAGTATETLIAKTRQAIQRIVHGKDDRLLVIIGPCSIHDPAAALDYARRLKPLREKYADTLEIVMRVYFEKPRTTVGWKGLINDPYLDESYRIDEGLRIARQLLIEINRQGLPAGSEFLDVISPQYIGDLISWGAIGARTTESQSHRQLASGLSCPVGFKNGTDGGVKVAADAVVAAKAAHAFMGMTKMGQAAIFETRGNQDVHIILRGGKAPNYSAADVDAACKALEASGIAPQVMVDVSHANSSKQHARQIEVAHDVATQVAAGDRRIMGLMIESHLNEGRQDLKEGQPLAHGVSITDACISMAQTVPVLDALAQAVQKRRRVGQG